MTCWLCSALEGWPLLVNTTCARHLAELRERGFVTASSAADAVVQAFENGKDVRESIEMGDPRRRSWFTNKQAETLAPFKAVADLNGEARS